MSRTLGRARARHHLNRGFGHPCLRAGLALACEVSEISQAFFCGGGLAGAGGRLGAWHLNLLPIGNAHPRSGLVLFGTLCYYSKCGNINIILIATLDKVYRPLRLTWLPPGRVSDKVYGAIPAPAVFAKEVLHGLAFFAWPRCDFLFVLPFRFRVARSKSLVKP